MRRLAAGLLALIVLISCAAVYAASGGESLITQTYLEETYVPGVLEQAQARVEEKTQSIYQSASSVLEGRHSAYLNGGNSALTDCRFKEGDVLTLPAGSGVLLLAGGASVSTGTLVDVTAGTALSAGAALTARHRGLAAEGGGTVTVTSDTAVLSLEGTYTTASGSGVDYNALADALRDMGLFQGTGTAYGSGYDLEVAPTRLVGLVMFLRLIGEEGAALSSTAAWCDRYVAYAYEQGYTQGIGPGLDGRLYFGANTNITAGEYVTFLLRALGYTDSGASPDFTWSTALDRAVELGVLTSAERTALNSGSFLRAQVVYLSYFALSVPLKDGSGILLDKTAASSGVDKSQLQAVMDGVAVSRLS